MLELEKEITERKQAEKELIKLSTAVQQSPSVIAITDLKGNLEYVNPKFTELTGYTSEEAIGQNSRILKSGEITDEIYKELWNTISSGKVWRGEFHNKKKNGELFWEAASISPIFDKQGKIINYIKVAEDITEHKRAEEELIKAKEKAEESDRLKTSFLLNMSHEIRTPMNGIFGFTNLLLKPGLTGEQQHEYIDVIINSSDRLMNTINDLMDISMIESGLVKVAVSEVNVNEQTKDLYTFFKPESNKKELQIICKNSLPEQEAIIKTDKEKLYSVLTNLVKNAIKYSNDGTIEFGYEKKGKNLEFFVKDTGIGIAKDRQQAIFDRFIQADMSMIRPYEGAGLGLSITKAYIEMLGGRIWVESQEGKGSQFYFTIPYNTDKKEITTDKGTISVTKSEHQIKDLKILIVEDDKISDSYLSRIVESISKEILHAGNGLKAVELCRTNINIDLVLMDIRLPVMDGYTATREIKKINPDIPVIAQTAYAMLEDKEKALEAGCDDYISKPINEENLINLLEKHLKK